ncbi:CDP-diacylglycerol--glycerol-3-phosphate 3-phosphatidyltransferase 1, chloroplastic-like protein [Drosera capensis]
MGRPESSSNGDVVGQGVSLSSSSSRGEKEEAKLLTLPTILTLGRVAAIPFFISRMGLRLLVVGLYDSLVCFDGFPRLGAYYVNSWWGTGATTSIFIAAAITDWLDGYIARKMRLGTAFGAFLDPVADKLIVAATLVLLCSRPSEAAMFRDMPWLLPVPAILIIGREITISAVREWAASQGSKLSEAVSVNNIGKWKTATQMIALTILLSSRDSSNSILASCGVALLYVSSGLSVWSLVVYGRKIWKVLLR